MARIEQDAEIGKRIGEYMADRGIMRTWLAEVTKIDRGKVYRYLNGEKAKVTIAEYDAICTALEVPLDFFLKK